MIFTWAATLIHVDAKSFRYAKAVNIPLRVHGFKQGPDHCISLCFQTIFSVAIVVNTYREVGQLTRQVQPDQL